MRPLPVKREQAPEKGQRGDDARRRLIDAAIEAFGERGFEGTSTRMLAEKAEVNLAAILYYFGGKEGLYRAAAQHIVDRTVEQMLAVTAEIESALKTAPLSRSDALRLLHGFLNTFATLIISPGEADAWSQFVMREQIHPGAAFEILYDGFMRKALELCTALLGCLLNQPKTDTALRIRAQAIMGQILFFRTSRTANLRGLGWKEFTGERVKLIQSVLRDNVDRIVSKRKPGALRTG